jgi:copper chaperone CopZ
LQSKLLAGSDEQDPLLEKVQGVESVTISLDPEVLVSTDLRQSLIKGKIRRLEQIKMLPL